MPATRARKRAASDEEVVDSAAAPRKTRQTKKSKAEVKPPASDDEQTTSNAAKDPPKKKTNKKTTAASKKNTKGKGKKVKDEEDEDDATNNDAVTDVEKTDEPKQESKPKPLDELVAGEKSTQFAKAEGLLIPADTELGLSNQYYVYIDDDRTIYDASLNQTNAAGNNNKFYKIQLLGNGTGSFRTWTRWGRVGEKGQSEILGDGSLWDARVSFEKKFKDKSGLTWENRLGDPKPKKYVFLERTYEAESDGEDDVKPDNESIPDSILVPEVQSLMKFIFNSDYIRGTMADMNYDASKLPLGNLSKSTILRGYQTLKDLGDLLDNLGPSGSVLNTSYKTAVEDLSNRYYSYIPHAFGRNRPPVIDTIEVLKREVQLLESLTDLKDVDDIMKPDKGSKINLLDAHYNGLGMREMTVVSQDSAEFTNIHDYLVMTRGQTHGISYKLLDVFRLEREGEGDRFKQLAEDKSDRRLLWHGSRSTNFGGILSQGLRIAPPEAPVSGYMFGKGVYLADMSSKSANYCYHYISNNEALLLLCEAELGNPMQELTMATYTAGEDALAKDMLSTWGQGMTGPKGWKDAGCIHDDLKGVKMPDTTEIPGNLNVNQATLYYNEYICYDVAQIRLRYLLRVKMA